MTCRHDKAGVVLIAVNNGRTISWCERCGAIQNAAVCDVWMLPAAAEARQRGKEGLELLGAAFRGAFPSATAKVEKFVAEATENSETLQWLPASDFPRRSVEAADEVLFLVPKDADPVKMGFLLTTGRWLASNENEFEYPADAVTHYAEKPKGPKDKE